MNAGKFLLVAVAVMSVSAAHARQVITKCGPMTGKSYYVEPKEGWTDDGIKNGSFTFIRDADGRYDIIVKDARWTFTAREDGATVSVLSDDDAGHMVISAVYPLNVVELYQLTLDKAGHGTLIYSSLRNDVPPQNSTRGSLFIADCNR